MTDVTTSNPTPSAAMPPTPIAPSPSPSPVIRPAGSSVGASPVLASPLATLPEVPPEFAAGAIAQHRFGSSFRGYDSDEVRTFLLRLSSHVKGLHEQVGGLRVELAAARSARLIVDLTTPVVGQNGQAGGEANEAVLKPSERQAVAELAAESAQVEATTALESARTEAQRILDRAHEEAGRIVLRARAESRGKQSDGRVAPSDSDSSSNVSLAGTVSGTGTGTVSGTVTGSVGVAAMAAGTAEAIFDVPNDPEAARAQARAMIQEARAVRERILTDLAKRRRTAHVQLEQLRVAREKLQETLREARRVIDASSRDVSHAEVDARLAAEAAGRRVNAEPLPTAEQLEIEVMGGRHLHLFQPADLPAALDDAMGESAEVGELGDVDDSAEVDAIEVDAVEDISEVVDAVEEIAEVAEEIAEAVEVAAAELDETLPIDEVAAVELDEVTPLAEVAEVEVVEVEVVEVEVEAVVVIDSEGEALAAEPEPELDAEIAADGDTNPVESSVNPVVGEGSGDGSSMLPSMPPAIRIAEPEPIIRKRRMDDVFARIRADRELSTAQAREVLQAGNNQVSMGTSALAPQHSPAPQTKVLSVIEIVPTVIEIVPTVNTEAHDQDELTASIEVPPPSDTDSTDRDATILERRNSDMELLLLRVSKQLKRHLQDEHSAALTAVRRTRGRLSVDAVLGTVDEQHGRATAVLNPGLEEAAQAGARSAEAFGALATGTVISVAGLVQLMANDVLQPIREALADALERQHADIGALLGQAFREWNTDRLGRRVRDGLSSAFASGLVGAVAPGVPMHWLVDHGDEPSPECDDNALEGTVANGELFPTGHSVPPLGPGCRCLVVPRS